jgi:hypothetical protein
MSKEMKLIMESWRKHTLNESTAGEVVDQIKKDLYIIAAKEAGGNVFKEVIKEFGEDVVNLALNSLGAVPGIGNVVSGLKAVFSAGKIVKKGFKMAKDTKQMMKPAADLLNIAKGKYIGRDENDSAAQQSIVGKILNVDDKMEFALNNEILNDFASKLVASLINNPDEEIPDIGRYADDKLAQYLVGLGSFSVAKPPQGA